MFCTVRAPRLSCSGMLREGIPTEHASSCIPTSQNSWPELLKIGNHGVGEGRWQSDTVFLSIRLRAMYFNSPGEDMTSAVLYMGQQWEERHLFMFVHLQLWLTEKKILACNSSLLKEDWCPLLRISCRQQTVINRDTEKVSMDPDLYSSTPMTPLSFFPNHYRNTYSYMGTWKAT